MVNFWVQQKIKGEVVAEKSFHEGELIMSDLGFTTVKYQRTIPQPGYASLVIGVEVSVPNDPALRDDSAAEIADAFVIASGTAIDMLNELQKKVG